MQVPLFALLGALFITFQILQYIQQTYRHRKQAKSLHCQPPKQGSSEWFGVPAFLRLAKAVKEKRWIDYITQQYGVHGNTFAQSFFNRNLVSTIEPDNIKALLATQFNDFSLGTRHKEFYPLLGDGIFTLDGAGWSHARGLLRPQFTRDQVSRWLFSHGNDSSAYCTIKVADLELLDGHIARLIDMIPKDRSMFDIQRLFFLLTIDSATHFLFGESVGSMHPVSTNTGLLGKSTVGNAQGFAEAFGTAQDYLAARSRAQSFYWMVNPKEFREANRRVHEVVDHYVQLAIESKRHPERKQSGGRYIFLEALAEDNDDPKVLRDNMLNILLAGRDTTASLLSSTFYYLARHPDVWNRLRQEIIEEFGDSRQPKAEITQTKLKDIPYLRHVLNEGRF